MLGFVPYVGGWLVEFEQQCRSALLLVLVFAGDFGRVFAELSYGKKQITQTTINRESPKSKRGRFLGLGRWCQTQAEDDQLQLTVKSLAPPPSVSGAVWCRATTKIGLKWILPKCILSVNISKESHQTSQTNAADSRMYAAAVNGER